jgi:hypothetical protein
MVVARDTYSQHVMYMVVPNLLTRPHPSVARYGMELCNCSNSAMLTSLIFFCLLSTITITQSMAALRRASISGSTPTSHIGGVTTSGSAVPSSSSSSSSSSIKHSPVLVNRVVVDKDRISKEAMYWRAYAAAISAQDPDEVSATASYADTNPLAL